MNKKLILLSLTLHSLVLLQTQSALANRCIELLQNETTPNSTQSNDFWTNLSSSFMIQGVQLQSKLNFTAQSPRLQELTTEKLPDGALVSKKYFLTPEDHRAASGQLGAPAGYQRPVLDSYIATSHQSFGNIQPSNVVISFADAANVQKGIDYKRPSKGPVILGKISQTNQPVALALFSPNHNHVVDALHMSDDHAFTGFRTNQRVEGLNDLDPYFYGVHTIKSGDKNLTALAYSLPPPGAKLQRGGAKNVTLETLQNYIQRNAFDSQFHEGAPNSGMISPYITKTGKLVYLPDHQGTFADWSGDWFRLGDLAQRQGLKVSTEANHKMAYRWRSDKHLIALMDALAKNNPQQLVTFFEWLKTMDVQNAKLNKLLEGDDFYARSTTAELSRFKALLDLAAQQIRLERPARDRNAVPTPWLTVLMGYAYEKNINLDEHTPLPRPWVQNGQIMGSRAIKRGDFLVLRIPQKEFVQQRQQPAVPADTTVIVRFDSFSTLLDGSVRMKFVVTWSEGNRVQQKQHLILDTWDVSSLNGYIADPAEINTTQRGTIN